MRPFELLICASLLLAGCDAGGYRIVHRSHADGRDLLHSDIRLDGRQARFHCVTSASGRCVYAAFPTTCAAGGPCDSAIRRFEVAAGRSLTLRGLPAFDACVSADAPPAWPGCATGTREGRTAALGPLRLHWDVSYTLALPVVDRIGNAAR